MKNFNRMWLCHLSWKGIFVLLFFSMCNFALWSQEITVSGTVRSALDDTPLAGVNVVVKGTFTGTVTDPDGNYEITAPSPDAILVFSFIGYLTDEVNIESRTKINLALVEQIEVLDEIVVIGYGVQRKSDLTGAVASVSAEELQKIPVSRFENTLQGKAAGIQVTQNTGAPGADVTVRVRGVSTLTTVDGIPQGKPLWIVDGIETNPDLVNVNDVESVEILKDASAAAIYGANGGSGVILITTKKGKTGKPEATVKYERSVQSVANKVDVATASEMGYMYTEYEALRGLDEFTFHNYNSLTNYDYQDLIFRDAIMDNLDFNVSGGTEKLAAYLGVGYVNQDGILDNTNFKKLNIRINSDYQAADWFKVGETMSFTRFNNSGFEQWEYMNEYVSPITGAISVLPYIPPYAADGNWNRDSVGEANPPMSTIDLLHKEFRENQARGTFYVIIEPLKNLTIESRISGGAEFKDDYHFMPTYNFGPAAGEFNNISSIFRRMEQTFNYNWQNIISYNTVLADNFNFGIMGAYEVGQNIYQQMSGTRQYLISEDPEQWYFDSSSDNESTLQFVRGRGNESANYSYIGRINLDYKGKYLIQSSFRRDYSSKFGPTNRVGNFPSFSAGWKFSEEAFIRNNLPFLSFGKLRYGWGKTGNSNIRDYAYYATVSYLDVFSYSFENLGTVLAQGAAPDVLANKGIHWEDIVSQNFGADLAFLNNRLSLTVERFERSNIGMLVPTTPPGYAGWTVRDQSQEGGNVDPRPIENIGKITNEGWEFTAGWKDSYGKFKYSVDVNYTYVKNMASDLGPDSVRTSGTARGLSGNICRTETGEELGNFYGFKIDGMFQESDLGVNANGDTVITNQPYTVNPSTGAIRYMQNKAQPGDFKFADTNNDSVLGNADMVIIGNPFPKHLLGVSINLEYGIFNLSMFWQGTFGNDIFNATKYYLFNNNGGFNWYADYVNDHYRGSEIVARDAEGNVVATFPENKNAEYPRLDPVNNNSNFERISSFYIEDGSYVRLKNIQLGVSLPQTWIGKIGLNEFKIYLAATNLLTFTKYSGMDPEIYQEDPLSAGIDKASYPHPRSFIIGTSIKL
jgi:TonB-linked SusC/RagA family outer membrane protein